MSHMIENAIFSQAEGAGWTGLGQVIDPSIAKDPAKMAELLGATFHIVPRPLSIQLPDGSYQQITNRKAMVRDDTWETMGLVSENRYDNAEYRQPTEVLEAFRDALDANRLTISHGATLNGGARIAVSALLPADHDFMVGGKVDKVSQYLTLSTGYDGKTSTRRSLGTIRVVCANTLAASISESAESGKLTTRRASQGCTSTTLQQMIDNAQADMVETKRSFDALANRNLSAVELARYFGDVLEIDISQLNHVDPKGRNAISTKSRNMLTALAAAYDSAPGAALAHGNAWGALNAVTWYATHAKTCRDSFGSGAAAARYASNFDGDAARLKARALALATQLVAA